MYVHICVLIPVMTFYDVHKTTIYLAAKPRGISPNPKCQRSLVILSYHISPSYFPTIN